MSVTILTPTGGRQRSFALLAHMLSRQTYQGSMRWIIVDDVEQMTPLPDVRDGIKIIYVRPSPLWEPRKNTQHRNLLAGLEAYEGGDLLICEDDDNYAPQYVAQMAKWLEKYELVGEGNARYYNVPNRRWHVHKNTEHASLCETGMRESAVDEFRKSITMRTEYIDVDLWKANVSKCVMPNIGLCVGIKGMPGRAGIGVGHSPTFGIPDPEGIKLREWIGNEAEWYFAP